MLQPIEKATSCTLRCIFKMGPKWEKTGDGQKTNECEDVLESEDGSQFLVENMHALNIYLLVVIIFNYYCIVLCNYVSRTYRSKVHAGQKS